MSQQKYRSVVLAISLSKRVHIASMFAVVVGAATFIPTQAVAETQASAKTRCDAAAAYYTALQPGYNYYCAISNQSDVCYLVYENGPQYYIPQHYCWDTNPPPPPPSCPVAALTPITDPVALLHENGQYAGRPDLDNVNANVSAGASCIVQKAAALRANAVITSGFRPAAYQSHLREVWDKWQLLKNNSSPQCATIKAEVGSHWVRHAIVRQPGTVSNHTSGNAVDIAGVPSVDADSIAKGCNMKRPLSDDSVHYEPR